MKRLLWLLILISLPAWGSGATLHVSPSGTDSASCGASAPGCKTIQAAINSTLFTGTGNTILLHTGTITPASCTGAEGGSGTSAAAAVTITSSKSGAAGAYNVIKAANDGVVNVSAGACEKILNINGAFIQIGGLGTGEGFTVLGDSPMTSSLDGFPADGPFTLRNDSGANHDCRIYGLNFLANTAAHPFSGSSTVPADVGMGQLAMIGSGVKNHHIAGNTFRMGNINSAIKVNNTGAIGTYNCDATGGIDESGVIIENNVFLHDTSDVNDGNTGRKQFYGGERQSEVIIRNNYFRMCTAAAPCLGDGNSGTGFNAWGMRSACHFQIYNNYIEWYAITGGNGILYQFNGNPGETIANSKHKVYNNTFYGNNASIVIFENSGTGSEYFNNIIRGTAPNAFGVGIRPHGSCPPVGNQGATIGYNSFLNVVAGQNTSSTCAQDTLLGNDRTADPNLTLSGARPVPFFALQASSTDVIDHGCNRTTVCPNAPAADYDGTSRSNPGDIGADEFGGGGGAFCGDGSINGTEQCDNSAASPLGGATCVSRGFAQGGTLACSGSCTFDTINCCGDNQKGSTEVCDGTDLASQTCITQGFSGGPLSCATNCASFNTSSCTIATTKSATLSNVTCNGCGIQ